MQRLIRPWRMDYVSGPKEEACFFCAAIESTDDAGNLVVARRPHALAILNRYPYNSGHVMIVQPITTGTPNDPKSFGPRTCHAVPRSEPTSATPERP